MLNGPQPTTSTTPTTPRVGTTPELGPDGTPVTERLSGGPLLACGHFSGEAAPGVGLQGRFNAAAEAEVEVEGPTTRLQ